MVKRNPTLAVSVAAAVTHTVATASRRIRLRVSSLFWPMDSSIILGALGVSAVKIAYVYIPITRSIARRHTAQNLS